MSGGSYDYAYSKVQDMAIQMSMPGNKTPLRRAFAKHLHLVANAMKEIEWRDSGDTSDPEAEEKAIRLAMPNSDRAELEEIKQGIEDLSQAAEELLKKICREQLKQ